MISWMQKHNKYLVWTIWIATIAFIGAGFVGWGSYDLGSKAGSIAKVGEIEIKQSKLNMVYRSIYSQYNQALGGKLDDKKAKEMGLIKQAFSQIETQAKLLNFSKELGIIVSDAEIAKKLQTIPSFQEKGVFNRVIYDGYLRSQRVKAKDFEETLREDITIQKTLALINVEALKFEMEAIGAGMGVSDKIAYQVLSNSDLNFKIDENKLKAYWDMNKENFNTKKAYNLSVVWTPTSDTNVTENEIKAYYEANTFNYTNAEGKQLLFAQAKDRATTDLKIKKSKKIAQRAYIAFKKKQLTSTDVLSLKLGDSRLTESIWKEIETKSIGDILKPKVVGDTYATIKIEKVISPRVKTYEEAQKEASVIYGNQAQKEALMALAEVKLKEFNQSDAIISDFLKLEENVVVKPLNSEESLKFLQKLFTSYKEKGIISVSNRLIVYNIIEQKVTQVDKNETNIVKETTNKLKQSTFESNLIKILNKRYPTEVYRGGLRN
ncbi:MAG: SurA N-terminal domain-containing protein [Sulfurovum sp.]